LPGMSVPFHEPFSVFQGLPVVAFVTERSGGVSRPPFDSLNLAYLTADRRERVRRNRERLAAALGVGHDSLLIGRQVHGAQVNRAEQIVLGQTPGDAVVLTGPGQVAFLVVADCLPLVLYDPAEHVGAVAHAGWRGLAAGILPATVEGLIAAGAVQGRLRVGIGPAIGPCCYEVGPEVLEAVRPEPGEYRNGDKDRSFLDLALVARRQLEGLGVGRDSIEPLGICTRCNVDRYFSARAGEPTGRFAVGLKLL
jgi:purine-nucleoside/S-methyl-5'-thioadenosine phosphorylase / adenosine deaminase